MLRKLVVPFLAMVLAACGGGGGSGGGTPDAGSSSSTVQTGTFIDSAVAGLSYTTPTQSGTTDANGRFSYMSGETITFRIGSIVLGTTTAKASLTPIDLVSGAQDENNPTVVNIIRLLQTLDDDDNPANGITITSAIRAAAASPVNFAVSVVSFEADTLTTVNQLTTQRSTGARLLVAEATAKQHFKNTLLARLAGTYSGTYSGGDNGTWTVVITGADTFPTPNINGSGVSNVIGGNFQVQGFIATTGAATMDVPSIGGAGSAIFTANINPVTGTVSGSWQTVTGPAASGTLTGSRQ